MKHLQALRPKEGNKISSRRQLVDSLFQLNARQFHYMAGNCRCRAICKAHLLDNNPGQNYRRNMSPRCHVELQHLDCHLLHSKEQICLFSPSYQKKRQNVSENSTVVQNYIYKEMVERIRGNLSIPRLCQ